jgi:hypothetical protein
LLLLLLLFLLLVVVVVFISSARTSRRKNNIKAMYAIHRCGSLSFKMCQIMSLKRHDQISSRVKFNHALVLLPRLTGSNYVTLPSDVCFEHLRYFFIDL